MFTQRFNRGNVSHCIFFLLTRVHTSEWHRCTFLGIFKCGTFSSLFTYLVDHSPPLFYFLLVLLWNIKKNVQYALPLPFLYLYILSLFRVDASKKIEQIEYVLIQWYMILIHVALFKRSAFFPKIIDYSRAEYYFKWNFHQRCELKWIILFGVLTLNYSPR